MIKLNYTSLQHPVDPVEIEHGEPELGPKPPTAGDLAARPPGAGRLGGGRRRGPGLRVGFLQGAGAALPGSLSRDVARAARARPALRPRHRRACLRRRARGDQPGRRARRRRAPARLGGDRRRPRARDPRLGDAPRPRRHGGARRRARGARARPADAALPADVELRRARRATAASATTRRRCSSCCSRPVRVPVPEAELEGWPLLGARRRPAGGSAQAALDELIELCTGHHDLAVEPIDLDGYAASGLPATTMGRSIDEDPLFFAAPLAGGPGVGGGGRAGRDARWSGSRSRRVYEGRIVDVADRRVPLRRRRDRRARDRRPPGRGRDRRPRRRARLPGAPAARGGRRAGAARAAGRQARRRGRVAARVRAARARRGDRDDAPRSWTRAEALLHLARVRRRRR